VEVQAGTLAGLPFPAVASDPPADLLLTPLKGKGRTVGQLLTTFHLLLIALDPFTDESAWILPTAARIFHVFEQADCRVAWLVAGTADECRQFLGPWAEEVLTFSDPDRTAVKAFGLSRLPAILHVGMDGKLGSWAEGWRPMEWRKVTDELARVTSWGAPKYPMPGDPGSFEGSPALG
jgi:hypothetical protein